MSSPAFELEQISYLAALSRVAGSAADASPYRDWFRVLEDVAGVGIWDWTVGTDGALCTDANRLLYGLPAGPAMPPQDEWLKLIHEEDRARVCGDLELALSGSSVFETEFRVLWPDGSVHWLAGKGRAVCDAMGRPVRIVGVNYDITRLKLAEQASREAAEKRKHQSRHDPLTGLVNRRYLDERLKQAIRKAAGHGGAFAVLCIDLDGFKVVNDTLGHPVGDGLLRAVATRLAACLSEHDTLARVGGDEFTVVLAQAANRQAAESQARFIMRALQKRFQVAHHSLYVAASVGICMFPEDGIDAGMLQQNADIAMYHSKRHSRNSIHFFTSSMREPLRERLSLENALRGAEQRGEMSVHYQPQFRLAGHGAERCPSGFEALLRWSHPRMGSVSPGRFIPVAEESGLIVPIGTWVLEEVCRQLQRLNGPRVHVNVSGLQFAAADFVEVVERILCAGGTAGAKLGIEITESVLMSDFESSSRKIRELQSLGVSISVDDFGTGYSCLGYLQRLPIDCLKVDGSFVREIGVRPAAVAVVTGIVSLAHSLNMQVIAECIETEEQLAAVASAGCDEAQGYLLGRPAPAEALRRCADR